VVFSCHWTLYVGLRLLDWIVCATTTTTITGREHVLPSKEEKGKKMFQASGTTHIKFFA
jgi:hypothetical protein